jgi:hypothetical protein
MAGKNALGSLRAEEFSGAFDESLLRASSIRNQRGWRDHRADSFQLRQDAADGCGEDDHVTVSDGALQIGFRSIDGVARLCNLQDSPLVAANDVAVVIWRMGIVSKGRTFRCAVSASIFSRASARPGSLAWKE